MSMVFIAGRFHQRFRLQGFRNDLQRAGHVVCSRWLDQREESEGQGAQYAAIDLEDLELADIVIVIADEPRSHSRGGFWVEMGYALGRGKRVIVVGCKANVYCHLPQVSYFDNFPMACEALSRPMRLAA